jgi:hypothetical protein
MKTGGPGDHKSLNHGGHGAHGGDGGAALRAGGTPAPPKAPSVDVSDDRDANTPWMFVFASRSMLASTLAKRLARPPVFMRLVASSIAFMTSMLNARSWAQVRLGGIF